MHQVPLKAIDLCTKKPDDRRLRQRERGLDVGDLPQGDLQTRPGGLDIAQRVHEHHGVVRAERFAVPRTSAAALDDLLDQELPAVALARSLDLHALSFSVTSSSTRSASSKGSTGLTNHASAPDHLASQASCLRSRRITITPVYGSAASRRCFARAKAPARLAISSATITCGRSRVAAAMPSSPFFAARNRISCPSARSIDRTARAMSARDEGSGE